MTVWAARDKDKELWLYDCEPVLSEDETFYVDPTDGVRSEISSDWFPEVTFKNSPVIIKSDKE